mmetsp:Transcript_17545/g.15818  ORF Transcript_17545/g.15818 Transcript_17545/m.15818 type:complete len:329 (+) Transcript_17545:50-1036(+)
MKEYFRKYGFDYDQLNLSADFPKQIHLLRFDHILQIQNEELTNILLTPINPINVDNKLTHNIYRISEFHHDVSTRRSKAFLMRSPKNCYFDDVENKVYPQPKGLYGGFNGLSCNTRRSHYPGSILLQEIKFCDLSQDDKGRKIQIKQIRDNSEIKVKLMVSFVLKENSEINRHDWLVDYDQIGDESHVTVGVSKIDGVDANSPNPGNVSIQSITDMGWQEEGILFVFKAEAIWREDYLPDNDEWLNITEGLNIILSDGDEDDFFEVWRIHSMISEVFVSSNFKQNLINPLERILNLFENFLISDACDPNEGNYIFLKAIKDLKILINR